MAIEINGLEVALGRLDDIADLARVERGISQACLLVEREAKKKAPKGQLQQSITSKVENYIGTVYTPLRYAPYVEYGTGLFATGEGGGRKDVPWVYVEGTYNEKTSSRRYTVQEAREAVAFLRSKGLPAFMTNGQKPQPYLRPALDESREDILRILGEALLDD